MPESLSDYVTCQRSLPEGTCSFSHSCWPVIAPCRRFTCLFLNHERTIAAGGRPSSTTDGSAPGRPLCLERASQHLQRNATQKICLADIHAAMTQDRVGGGEVEIHVRQHEDGEIVVTLHLPLLARAERNGDLSIGRRVDLLGVERLEEGDGLGDAGFQLGDRGLGILVAWRLDAGEARGAVLGEVSRDLHLPGQRKHVGREPGVEQDRWVDLLGGCEGLGLVKDGRQRVEAYLQSRKGCTRHRERHETTPVLSSKRGVGKGAVYRHALSTGRSQQRAHHLENRGPMVGTALWLSRGKVV